jgi:hypothetical protein
MCKKVHSASLAQLEKNRPQDPVSIYGLAGPHPISVDRFPKTPSYSIEVDVLGT